MSITYAPELTTTCDGRTAVPLFSSGVVGQSCFEKRVGLRIYSIDDD